MDHDELSRIQYEIQIQNQKCQRRFNEKLEDWKQNVLSQIIENINQKLQQHMDENIHYPIQPKKTWFGK